MNKIILGGLFLVLLVCGCTSLPFNLSNPFAPSGPTVKELPPDILSIQNVNTIPTPPVHPGDQFSVSFEVKNQEENRMVNNVNYELFDTGLCDWIGGEPNDMKNTFTGGFAPQETKLVDWTFQAPNIDKIAHLSTTCPIRFKISYDFAALSQIDVDVISQQRLWDLQRAGNQTTYTPTLNAGRGPIKVYFDFGTTLPVRANSTLPVYLTVMDKGTGLYSSIENSTFIIKFPDNFTVNADSCDHFNCGADSMENLCSKLFGKKESGNGYVSLCDVIVDGKIDAKDISYIELNINSYTNYCVNSEPIIVIKRNSPQIRCSVKTPDVPIEKTYFISAGIYYTYDVEGESRVDVNP